jgi:ABC-2 type transport system permease protein
MMKKLSIELKKITPYPTFWIFAGLYVLMVILVFCSIPAIKLPGLGKAIDFKTYYTFPDIWHTLTYIAGLFNLLLGVLMIILITNEFTFRTVRQNIIDGWSITDVLSAKVSLLILLAICTTLFVFLLGMIYGLIASPAIDSTSIFGQINFILAYFVQALAYLCFALFMGTLFKKAGMGIIFFLLYSKIVEPLIGWRLPDFIKNYLPFHNISNLIDFPAVKVAGMTIYNSDSPLGIHFILTLVYSALFIFATYLLLKKRDN